VRVGIPYHRTGVDTRARDKGHSGNERRSLGCNESGAIGLRSGQDSIDLLDAVGSESEPNDVPHLIAEPVKEPDVGYRIVGLEVRE